MSAGRGGQPRALERLGLPTAQPETTVSPTRATALGAPSPHSKWASDGMARTIPFVGDRGHDWPLSEEQHGEFGDGAAHNMLSGELTQRLRQLYDFSLQDSDPECGSDFGPEPECLA